MHRSWLHDDAVKLHVMQFLNSLPTGKVTPCSLTKHVNSILFPELRITLAKPLNI